MKASIKKHPWAWVIGSLLAGGLFLSSQIKGTVGRVRGAL